MEKIVFDAGEPIVLPYEGGERGIGLDTHVCAATDCPGLHLLGAEVDRDAIVDLEELPPGEEIGLRLDVETRELAATNERGTAYLASARGPWLRAQIEDGWGRWQTRYDHLVGQREDAPPDTRRPPRWEPGKPIFHREVYPFDFTPVVDHAGESWFIDDAGCVDPACACDESTLVFHGAKGRTVEVRGKLGDRRGRSSEPLGKALWDAVRSDLELLDELHARKGDLRIVGPYVVGVAYERARVDGREGRPGAPLDPHGGYLQDGACPEAVVRRLFETGARFHAARLGVSEAWWNRFRIEVRGALAREAWGMLGDEPLQLRLGAEPVDGGPVLLLSFEPRVDASLAHRAQRCALDLPLIAGELLPLSGHTTPVEDGGVPEPRDPSADDARFLVAVMEALLATTPALSGALYPEGAPPQRFEHLVELDVGAVDVALVASDERCPWVDEEAPEVHRSHEHGEGCGCDDEGCEGCDDEGCEGCDACGGDACEGCEDEDCEGCEACDEEEAALEVMEPALGAFVDAALDRGVPLPVVETARTLLLGLGDYVAESKGAEPWYTPSVIERFLLDYAPANMALGEQHAQAAGEALGKVADWLEEAGYGDARRLRFTLDRTIPTFQKRFRKHHPAIPAGVLLDEARAKGVKVEDTAAVVKLIAETVAAPPSSPKERSATRWKPAPGEKAPAPTEPCGCGSGRRYKKCCMPR